MSTTPPKRSRILILEQDRKTAPQLQQFAIKDFPGASVQSIACSLADIAADSERFRGFDTVVAGCDFSEDGSSESPLFKSLRALKADPAMPPIVVLAANGSEFTAAQAIRAGAFDYLPKSLFGREQIRSAIQRALAARQPVAGLSDGDVAPRLFGYDLRRCLAATENAAIHVGFSAEQGREVVIKILNRGRGSLSRDKRFAKFVDEFKILHDIDDPAVAGIYDFRVTSEYCYIAMEYFERGHLGRVLRAGVEPHEALQIAKEIAGALSIIHMAGIVHRDLKPGNIMLRQDGSIALIDFGISLTAALGHFDDETIAGTPYYMSPEQADGQPTDERTDLYALGVIIFEMLAGEKPYTGADVEAILDSHRRAPLPPFGNDLAVYEPLVHRLMAKSADERPASARELIEIIDGLAETAAYAESASSVTAASSPAKS